MWIESFYFENREIKNGKSLDEGQIEDWWLWRNEEIISPFPSF